MDIEQFNDSINQIKSDLEEVKNSALSEDKRKEKIEDIKERAIKTKEDLEEKIATLTDRAKEKAEALLNSLNEIINFKLSIGGEKSESVQDTADSSDTEQPSDSSDTEQSTGPSDTEQSADKEGFFSKTKTWIGDQWKDIRSKDKWSEEKGKNILRTVGFAATGVGLFALVYSGAKKLFGKEAREERKRKRAEKKAEKQRKKEERKAEIEALSFWKRPFGKFLKRTGIGAGLVGSIYLLGKRSKKSEKSGNEASETTPESNLSKLHGFESECKNLKAEADNCLAVSRSEGADYLDNKKKYDETLNKALNLQTQAETVFNEISGSDVSAQEKTEAESLKNNINSLVEEIKVMKDEIYATVQDGTEELGDQGGNGGGGAGEVKPERVSPSEKLDPVPASVVSQAAIDYLDKEVSVISLNQGTKSKIKKTLDNYFESYPILKKDKNNDMICEIGNKTEFSKMVKQLWDDILSGLGKPKRFLANRFVGNKLEDINNTMKTVDPESYENIVFNYFGGIIKNAVKAENGSITVQAYYDGIKKAYPNANISKVDRDLASSGQANKDIKDMHYPLA